MTQLTPPPHVTPEVVRLALRAIRAGQPLRGSPLLDLAALAVATRSARLSDSPEARCLHLPTWLDQIVSEQVGFWRTAADTAGRPPSAIAAGANRKAIGGGGDTDHEAWTLLHAYYFSGAAESQRDITARLPLSFKTARRRLERGYQLLADMLNAKEQAAVRSEARARTVPRPYTRFIGREAELGHIRRLMAAHRCVVLTGPGGVGKSRLAIRLAQDLADDYPDDAWFVEIAALSDGRQVTQAVMAALGARESPGQRPADTLAEHIADKRLILVIDNCEHLAEACGSLIAHLLAHCGQLQVLATSRVELPVAGAKHWPVPPMTLPADVADIPPGGLIHFDAPRLFGARAAVAKADFTLTDATAGPVGRICARLDGLPLAIELAAARVAELSLDQLESRLADRFALLKDGRRATRRSHETLQAMMDWSYDLLSEPEKRLLRRLSVFRGGWTLEAAEEVCAGEGVEAGDVAGLLNRLEAKSLVQARDSERDQRWDMLETVREYAYKRLDRVGEVADRRDRHAAFFVQFVHGAKPFLEGPEQLSWLQRLDLDRANLTSALEWILQRGLFEQGSQLSADLFEYWQVRGEWIQASYLIGRLLAAGEAAAASPARELALINAGNWAVTMAHYDEARAYLEEALELCQSLNIPTHLSRILNSLAIVAELGDGDLTKARVLYEQVLEVCREQDDLAMEAATLVNLGDLVRNMGEVNEAIAMIKEAIEIDRARGHQSRVAFALTALGTAFLDASDSNSASHYVQEAVTLSRAIGDRATLARALCLSGIIRRREHDFRAALEAFEDGLAVQREIGYSIPVVHFLAGIASAQHGLGQLETARRSAKECIALCTDLAFSDGALSSALGTLAVLEFGAGCHRRAATLIGAALRRTRDVYFEDVFDAESVNEVLDAASAALGQEACDAAYAEGVAMSTEKAIAYALDRSGAEA